MKLLVVSAFTPSLNLFCIVGKTVIGEAMQKAKISINFTLELHCEVPDPTTPWDRPAIDRAYSLSKEQVLAYLAMNPEMVDLCKHFIVVVNE